MFYKEVYSVFLDGSFVGICEEEDECWEVAQNELNGIDVLLDDDVDRVFWEKIDVNRWRVCDKARMNLEDKYTGESILCANVTTVKEAVEKLNKIDLERERAEAKLRAMAL